MRELTECEIRRRYHNAVQCEESRPEILNLLRVA